MNLNLPKKKSRLLLLQGIFIIERKGVQGKPVITGEWSLIEKTYLRKTKKYQQTEHLRKYV